MSLRWKIILALLAVTLTSLAVTVRVASDTALGVLLRDRQSRALATAAFFAGSLAEPIAQGDRERLTNQVAALRVQELGRVLAVDEAGFVLADTAAGTDASLIGHRLEHVEIRSALEGTSRAGVHRLPDRRYAMYAAAPVRAAGDRVVGAVVLSTDVSDVFAAVDQIRGRMIQLGVVIAVAAGVVAYGFGAYLAAPLREMARAAGRIARGRFDERVPVRGGDELAQLARAFNDMAAHLARIDESRRDFIASASHELRTPVAALKTLTDALIHDPDATVEDYREFLRDIDDQVERLARLTSSLLTLARLDRETETVDLRPVPLAELVTTVVGWLEPEARRLGCRIRLEGRGNPQVLVDRTKMERALTNLVENAMKYGGPGLVRVVFGEQPGFDAGAVGRLLAAELARQDEPAPEPAAVPVAATGAPVAATGTPAVGPAARPRAPVPPGAADGAHRDGAPAAAPGGAGAGGPDAPAAPGADTGAESARGPGDGAGSAAAVGPDEGAAAGAPGPAAPAVPSPAGPAASPAGSGASPAGPAAPPAGAAASGPDAAAPAGASPGGAEGAGERAGSGGGAVAPPPEPAVRVVGDDEPLRRSPRVAWVWVIDRGPGIPAEELPHLFERFYRLDRARARGGDAAGAGLGLSIVREIMRLHDGVAVVASQVGRGSVFALYWPVTDWPPQPPADAVPTAATAATAGSGAGTAPGTGR
ncbi:ATP-binding protein [Thermaerobacter composti]|uniref:Signal transduction histidine-protein kinase/phosphatase MprB n=1 Tax=Thermaerobacter composti TaxID=554949 RepID=A0ABZ0QT35_9FIRM|nr:ATP-binding protein [Thermaerobacter composti]WPD19638.1 HAMP domain-containing protein [Thermaerobacter composti]